MSWIILPLLICVNSVVAVTYGPSMVALTKYNKEIHGPTLFHPSTGRLLDLSDYPNHSVIVPLAEDDPSATSNQVFISRRVSGPGEFVVQAPDGYGVMAVIQSMDLRTAPSGCNDFIQFGELNGGIETTGTCGKVDNRDGNFTPNGLIGPRVFLSHSGSMRVLFYHGYIWGLVRDFNFDLLDPSRNPVLRLEVVFTAYKECDPNSYSLYQEPEYRSCTRNINENVCIPRGLFCDRVVNCAFEDGFASDELVSNCYPTLQSLFSEPVDDYLYTDAVIGDSRTENPTTTSTLTTAPSTTSKSTAPTQPTTPAKLTTKLTTTTSKPTTTSTKLTTTKKASTTTTTKPTTTTRAPTTTRTPTTTTRPSTTTTTRPSTTTTTRTPTTTTSPTTTTTTRPPTTTTRPPSTTTPEAPKLEPITELSFTKKLQQLMLQVSSSTPSSVSSTTPSSASYKPSFNQSISSDSSFKTGQKLEEGDVLDPNSVSNMTFSQENNLYVEVKDATLELLEGGSTLTNTNAAKDSNEHSSSSNGLIIVLSCLVLVGVVLFVCIRVYCCCQTIVWIPNPKSLRRRKKQVTDSESAEPEIESEESDPPTEDDIHTEKKRPKKGTKETPPPYDALFPDPNEKV